MATAPSIQPAVMPLVSHLEELRWRLIKSLALVAATTVVGFCARDPLFALLLAPVHHLPLVLTNPAEGFKAAMLVSLYAGLVLAAPGLLYQAIAFLAPGLRPAERRTLVPMLGASMALFALGAWLSYAVMLPAGLKFLLGFSPADVSAMLSLEDYIGFAVSLVFAGGLLCQLPIVLVGLAYAGVVTSEQLARYRRHAMFGAFALGAVASPAPDPVSQGVMAGVLFLLYEGSRLAIRLGGR